MTSDLTPLSVEPSIASLAQAPSSTAPPAETHDPTRSLRAKALACTAPLHDLQRNRRMRGWEAFDLYDMSLVAVDLVVDKMAYESGISGDELVADLARRARQQVAEAGRDKALEVAEGVVAALIRPTVSEYTTEMGDARRQFEFALLTEHERPDGTIYVRATNQAINVLVGGLNIDIESAQIAAEAQITHLLSRQRLAEATLPALQAKMRSIQYVDYVRQVIADTKRDVRRAGWRESVRQRLEEIREHLQSRMDTEYKIVSSIQEKRDFAEREDLRAHAAQLVLTVNSCFDRHAELHRYVLEATQTYVSERNRQTAGRLAMVEGVDLTDDLLLPVLAAPIALAEPLIVSFAEHLLGMGPGAGLRATPWRQPSLGDFLCELLRDAQPHDEFGEELPEVLFEEAGIDAFAFSEEAAAIVERVLADLAVPRRISDLLREARAYGFDAADLVRLRALLATAPELSTTKPGDRVIVAVADGTTFDEGPFAGDDLLVGAATKLVEERSGGPANSVGEMVASDV